MQGLQVAEKQKVSPWDILEGHKNPAPLSWNWFQAIKTERKPLKYEEAFQNMKYMKNSLLKPASYYLEDPPLPQEDLEPSKDSKDDDKNNKNKEDFDSQLNGKRGAKQIRRGQSRIMSPGPTHPGGPNNMFGGQMGGPGNGSMYPGQQNSNMGYGNMGPAGGPPMGGPQMNFNQSTMNYGGSGGQQGPPGGGNFPSSVTGANVQGGGMQGTSYSSGGPPMMPGTSNSKVALQNMLRNRLPGPSGQFVGGPGGGGSMGPGGMMRPGGQYSGNMMGGG